MPGARSHALATEQLHAAGIIDMELTILRDEESFLAIEPQWRDLSARMSSQYLFQSFNWVKPWWACHGSRKRKRLHIIHGTENGRTVLIWPLLIDSGTPWRMLRWMGADGDCADILVEDGGQAEARIQQAWHPVPLPQSTAKESLTPFWRPGRNSRASIPRLRCSKKG